MTQDLCSAKLKWLAWEFATTVARHWGWEVLVELGMCKLQAVG